MRTTERRLRAPASTRPFTTPEETPAAAASEAGVWPSAAARTRSRAGVIRSGVTLSQSQAQQIDTQAGRSISPTVSTRGWYLLFGDPANVAQARQNRTSPAASLWYTDGGSVQQITIASRAII